MARLQGDLRPPGSRRPPLGRPILLALRAMGSAAQAPRETVRREGLQSRP